MTDQFSPGDMDRGRLSPDGHASSARDPRSACGPREDSESANAGAQAHEGGAQGAVEHEQPGTTSPAPALSPAVSRFRSCRWRRAPEDNGGIECCGHRDVLPLAGSTSFDAEAWCPDCGFYKLRRTPKKREYPY